MRHDSQRCVWGDVRAPRVRVPGEADSEADAREAETEAHNGTADAD